MRGSVVGSGLFHVLLVVGIFLVRQPMNIIVPGPDVVQVSLVDPSGAVTPTAPPQVEPPTPEPEPVKPLEEEGVKIEKQVPKPKQPEKPRPTPQPAKTTSASAPALPSAAVGPPGLKADVGVDAGNFEYTYYLALIRDRIIGNWSAPAGISTGGREVRAEVYFRIGRHGEISDIRIQVGSGIDAFDRSAQRAVTISDPLPPLPLGFTEGHLGVLFGLNWEAQ
jgi:TonB family protein